MHLDKIITTTSADPWNRLRFLAMERSLRAVGCQLPLRVIPYNEERFALPPNARWWEAQQFFNCLERQNAKLATRKYICLTVDSYQYADTDIIFIRNPEAVLIPYAGFVTSCGHWHNPHNQIYTQETLPELQKKSTLWQKSVFNAGQFACDRKLYASNQILETCTQASWIDTCLHFSEIKHEQPGMNLLVSHAGVPVTNLSLPPVNMESTWAGDYPDEHYEDYWRHEPAKPYLIHWAGVHMNQSRPIDKLFLEFLTEKEQAEWAKQVAIRYTPKPVKKKYGLLQPVAVGVKRIADRILPSSNK